MIEKPKIYIGIDPGTKGALCLLDPIIKRIGFHSTALPPADIVAWLNSIKQQFNPIIIAIEKVHAIQGTSAGSNFKFGYNVGLINAIAETSKIGVMHVTPKAWQKQIGVTQKGKLIKKNVAEIIHKIYPDAELYGPRGGLLDGRSDALALAHTTFLNYSKG